MHRMHVHPPPPPPPCACVHPPPRPCASPPSPAWKAGYEKRWCSGQQEKNASLFTCDLKIFCRISLYIKKSLLIDMDLEKVNDILPSKNRRLHLWMYVVCQLRLHLQCKHRYRLLVASKTRQQSYDSWAQGCGSALFRCRSGAGARSSSKSWCGSGSRSGGGEGVGQSKLCIPPGKILGTPLNNGVADPWHFSKDPDPQHRLNLLQCFRSALSCPHPRSESRIGIPIQDILNSAQIQGENSKKLCFRVVNAWTVRLV